MRFLRLTSIASAATFCVLVFQAQLTAQGTRDNVAGWTNLKEEIVDFSEISISDPSLETTAKLSPSRLSFGHIVTRTISPRRTVTLTNTGTSSLRINQIAIEGTDPRDFSHTHTCGTSLVAGASCAIEVTFEPIAFSTRSAILSVTDSASDSPQTVSLTGIGIAGSCVKIGGQCPPWAHCCPGLVCVPASTRAFCEPADRATPN